jgi:hypothetical protein
MDPISPQSQCSTSAQHHTNLPPLRTRLCSLIISYPNSPLWSQTLGPVPIDNKVGLWNLPVANEEPEAKASLGQDVKYTIYDNLVVNRRLVGESGDTPNTEHAVSLLIEKTKKGNFIWNFLHGIHRPED